MKLSRSVTHIIVVAAAIACCWLTTSARPPLALGVTYNYATEYGQHGIGAKLQLPLGHHWRVSPELIYFAKRRDVTSLHINVNVEHLLPVMSHVQVYPFAGISYSHWGYTGPNASRWGANLGAGLEISLGRSWAALGEARLMLVSRETQVVTSLGIKHLF